MPIFRSTTTRVSSVVSSKRSLNLQYAISLSAIQIRFTMDFEYSRASPLADAIATRRFPSPTTEVATVILFGSILSRNGPNRRGLTNADHRSLKPALRILIRGFHLGDTNASDPPTSHIRNRYPQVPLRNLVPQLRHLVQAAIDQPPNSINILRQLGFNPQNLVKLVDRNARVGQNLMA